MFTINNLWIWFDFSTSSAMKGEVIYDSGVILKAMLAFKTQYQWQNIYFYQQPNPLKSIRVENNLAEYMKINDRKSIMWPKKNYLLNAKLYTLGVYMEFNHRHGRIRDGVYDCFHLFWSFNCQLMVDKLNNWRRHLLTSDWVFVVYDLKSTFYSTFTQFWIEKPSIFSFLKL